MNLRGRGRSLLGGMLPDGGNESTPHPHPTEFPIVGGMGGAPHPAIFIKPTHQNWCLHGAPLSLLINEAPHLKNNPPLESEALFKEIIPRKKFQKIGNFH